MLLTTSWAGLARQDQIDPIFQNPDWNIWLVLGGRGSGKTRTGSEWINEQVWERGKKHIALVAPSLTDAREVMLDGESGLLNIGFPQQRPHFIASRRRLEWPNGAVGHIYSSADPDSLRGPQFDAAWGDEFCAWSYPLATLSNLRLALRLGDKPRLVMTTTPKPHPWLKDLLRQPGLICSRARTSDNAMHLAPNFLSMMEETYGGTQLGRQELDGDIVEDQAGALWSHQVLDHARIKEAPELRRVIVSIDPPTTSGPKSDRCGLIVAGVAGEGRDATAYLLEDASAKGLSPEGWARRAIKLYHKWGADCLLAETNQGGDMIKTILHQIDPDIHLRTVHASRSKTTRAEPVAALYEQRRVKHVGVFKALEDEMAVMGTDSLRHSPDRVDALVWAVTHLLLDRRATPRIRPI